MPLIKKKYNQGTAVVLYEKGSVEERLTDLLGVSYTRYRTRWHEAMQFRKRPSFPIHIDIELAYSCNLKCIMCPYGDLSYHHPDYYGRKLEQSVLKRVLTEGSENGLASVRFSLLNEPLLIPELPDLIALSKCLGIMDSYIATNGMLLTEERSTQLIEAGLTHLMVSLDAASAETYRQIRVGGDYDTVIHNIERFLEIRSAKRSELPLLRVSFIRMLINRDEENEFIRRWREKADYIAVAGYLNNIGENKPVKALSLSGKKLSELKAAPCSQPWVRCAIFANGDAYPCCLNYGRNYPVGNIYHQSLRDIWNSEKNRYIQNWCRIGKFDKESSACFECVASRELLDEH